MMVGVRLTLVRCRVGEFIFVWACRGDRPDRPCVSFEVRARATETVAPTEDICHLYTISIFYNALTRKGEYCATKIMCPLSVWD